MCTNPTAQKVGQMVLVNQFVPGLCPELQAKVVGKEGGMDTLILKAHLEEAKANEFTVVKTTAPTPKKATPNGATTSNVAKDQVREQAPMTS